MACLAVGMASPILATRYATRFSCIGGDCEDTCCTGWSISVDAAHYKKLKRALSQTKADREMFDQSVKKVRSGRSDTKFALIVLNEKTGYCN
jgi:lysine-N-methylase